MRIEFVLFDRIHDTRFLEDVTYGHIKGSKGLHIFACSCWTFYRGLSSPLYVSDLCIRRHAHTNRLIRA